METRRFGRTGHFSTVAILGGAAFGKVDQATADAAMERVIAAGVNHIDIAPSYGNAEDRVGPWIARERKRFFSDARRQSDPAKAGQQNSTARSNDYAPTNSICTNCTRSKRWRNWTR